MACECGLMAGSHDGAEVVDAGLPHLRNAHSRSLAPSEMKTRVKTAKT